VWIVIPVIICVASLVLALLPVAMPELRPAEPEERRRRARLGTLATRRPDYRLVGAVTRSNTTPVVNEPSGSRSALYVVVSK
jgi:hypothetical protein